MHSDKEILKHMRDEMQYLSETAAHVSKEQFLADETLKRAFARSLEIIGEASKIVSNQLVIANRDIQWRSMAGMRDKLIHAYFSIDYAIVWDVVVQKIPQLLPQIEALIQQHSSEN
jgi:uncharacterized protein with HEPN domain